MLLTVFCFLLSFCTCRYSLLRHSKERQKVDGLNNLNYSPLVSRRPLYTNITVSLSRKLAPIADYWRRQSWTAKSKSFGTSAISHQLQHCLGLFSWKIYCFVYFGCMQKKKKKENQKHMFDKSYKKIGINAALVCATVHHSSHLGLSRLQSPHAFCTILAFSIHSSIHFLLLSITSSTWHLCARWFR